MNYCYEQALMDANECKEDAEELWYGLIMLNTRNAGKLKFYLIDTLTHSPKGEYLIIDLNYHTLPWRKMLLLGEHYFLPEVLKGKLYQTFTSLVKLFSSGPNRVSITLWEFC